MGEANQKIICHITEREQIALARILHRFECKTRQEREHKVAAFDLFGLGWVRDRIEDEVERKLTAETAVEWFEASIAEGQALQAALAGVLNRALAIVDPFTGHWSAQPRKVEIDRKVLAWVFDVLDKSAAGGADDFAIAALEERFGRARASSKDYQLPPELAASVESEAASNNKPAPEGPPSEAHG
jgi:hypothetical protein